jgi:type II restriction enzyme
MLAKKGRAIVEVDTDGGYVMSETEVEESSKIKMFDKFIDDLRIIINYTK